MRLLLLAATALLLSACANTAPVGEAPLMSRAEILQRLKQSPQGFSLRTIGLVLNSPKFPALELGDEGRAFGNCLGLVWPEGVNEVNGSFFELKGRIERHELLPPTSMYIRLNGHWTTEYCDNGPYYFVVEEYRPATDEEARAWQAQ